MKNRRSSRIPLAQRFWPKVDARGPDECWLWTASRSRSGYGRIGMGGKRGPVQTASRVAWELSFGPVPEPLHVLHRCDNPSCVNPAHLFLGTQGDNNSDMIAKGRANPPRGEAHCSARFTRSQVAEIRAIYAAGGVSHRELGKRFSVSHKAIGRIVTRKTWSHV